MRERHRWSFVEESAEEGSCRYKLSLWNTHKVIGDRWEQAGIGKDAEIWMYVLCVLCCLQQTAPFHNMIKKLFSLVWMWKVKLTFSQMLETLSVFSFERI